MYGQECISDSYVYHGLNVCGAFEKGFITPFYEEYVPEALKFNADTVDKLFTVASSLEGQTLKFEQMSPDMEKLIRHATYKHIHMGCQMHTQCILEAI